MGNRGSGGLRDWGIGAKTKKLHDPIGGRRILIVTIKFT